MTAGIEARVYDKTGTILLRVLNDAKTKQFSDPLNDIGAGNVSVPVTSVNAQYLVDDNIVKFAYAGEERFGFVIESVTTQKINSSTRFRTATGRGINSILDDAILFPYLGLRGKSPSSRGFNFTTRDSSSHNLGVVWHGVRSRIQSQQNNIRKAKPANWPVPADRWMWASDPNVAAPANTENWFRFVGSWAAGRYRFWTTADGAYDFYIDGAVIASGADNDPNSASRPYEIITSTDYYMSAGTHTIGIRGQNDSAPVSSLPGVLLSIAVLDDKNKIASYLKPLYQKWYVTTTYPSWRAGDILYTLTKEAIGRNVFRLKYLTFQFDTKFDSDGVAWVTKSAREWDVGTSLLTIAQDLGEIGLDWAVGPDMGFYAWETRGTDKSGSIRLQGGSPLADYSVTETGIIKNQAMISAPNGWAERTDVVSQSRAGRREVMLTLGQQDAGRSATETLVNTFNLMGDTVITVDDGAMQPVSDARVRPYVDCGVGDIISVPGKDDGYVKARILSISMEENDQGAVTWTPELEVSKT